MLPMSSQTLQKIADVSIMTGVSLNIPVQYMTYIDNYTILYQILKELHGFDIFPGSISEIVALRDRVRTIVC